MSGSSGLGALRLGRSSFLGSHNGILDVVKLFKWNSSCLTSAEKRKIAGRGDSEFV